MDLNELKKLMARGSRKTVIVGSFIFAFGVFILWLILSGVDSESDEIGTGGMVVLYILVAICLFFGFFIPFKAIQANLQVKRGKHPLINAIKNQDQGFVFWIYEHIVQAKGGVSDHHVYIITNEGKQLTISAKKKNARRILQFLHEQFPSAYYGWSDDTNAIYKEKFRK